jgi:hypothetical protein
MRKSQSTTGFRPLRAGIAVAATAAAVVAGTSTPAFAADVAVTVTPAQVPSAGGTVLTVSGTNVFNGITAPGARFVAGTAACGTAYTTTPVVGTASGTVTKTGTDAGTVVVPSGLTPGSYKLCLFADTSSGAIAGHSSTNITVVPSVSINAPGPSAGNNVVPFTSTGTFTTATTGVGVTFTPTATPATAVCADRYTTTATGTTIVTGAAARSGTDANNTVNITMPSTLTQGTQYVVCLYNGTVAGTSALLARATNTYSVLPQATLNPKNGASGTTYTITLSTPTPLITASAPAVTFTTTACPTTYATGSSAQPFASGTVTKISNSKLAVVVPATVTATVPTAFNACLYADNTSGALLAAAPTLTVAPGAGFTTVVISSNGQTVTGGPAQGGSVLTFTGLSGLPTPTEVANGATLSASFGKSPLTDVTPISANSFSGTTTAHAAGADKLTVTTAAGSATTPATVYSFSYGITVTPNTAASGTPKLDILGSGFLNANISTPATASIAPTSTAGLGVFLVTNAWYPATTTILKTGLISQCTNIVIISDTELLCDLLLTNSIDPANSTQAYGLAATPAAVPIGVYNIVVVNDVTDTSLTADVDYSRISSGSTFTVAPY